MLEDIKLYYSKIKENLVIIALIPSVFGGIWQMFKLAQISPNMIRFFSISQLISDGLLLMIFFIFVPLISVTPILLTIHPMKHDFFSHKTPYDNYFRLIMYPLVLFLVFDYIFSSKELRSINELIHFLMGLCFFYIFIFSFSQVFIKKLFGKYFLLIVIFLINILISFYSFYKINKNEKTIYNFESLITTLKQKHCYSKQPKILYFNDQYIFIEVVENQKKGILIEKFDSLFEK
jgi:hypothetical protein